MSKHLSGIGHRTTLSRTATFVGEDGGDDTRADLAIIVPEFNVKLYGAKGDGVTSDSAAIQSALNACTAAGGGRVLLPPGVYLLTTLITVGSDVMIAGYGATLRSNSPALGVQLAVAGSRIRVVGLAFDGAHTGSGGATVISWGLVDIANSTATAYQDIAFSGCRFLNSSALAIRGVDHIDKLRVSQCYFSGHFESVFLQTTIGGTYTSTNCSVEDSVFENNWGAGDQSGACKVQGDYTTGLGPLNFRFERNIVKNCGEMGCEIWKNGLHCAVRGNSISNVDFGVSIDAGRHILVSDNVIEVNSYCGIEFAVGTKFCSARNNTIYEYAADGTRSGNHGIISSGEACTDNVYDGNTVIGANGSGIELQGNVRSRVANNSIVDCGQLINFKKCDYASARGNHLYGPCGYHVFLDYNDAGGTNVEIMGNYFYGAAANDNIIAYDAGHGNSLSNLTITFNDASAATFTNLSINLTMATPNCRVWGNNFVAGAPNADFSDFATTLPGLPSFTPFIQKAGLSVAAKRVIAFTANASPQWFKVLSMDYGHALVLQLHAFGTNTEQTAKNALSAFICASPYGQSSTVHLYPSGNYNGGIIDEVIYDNPLGTGGSKQEVWIKIKPTSGGGTIDLHFSDYAASVISTPTAVTPEPTWSTNNYRAQIELGCPQSTQGDSFFARSFIASGLKGAIASPGARFHVRGPGVNGGTSVNRIMRLDLADGTEAVAVDDTGMAKINKKVSVGGGPGVAALLMGEGNIDFGTILANAKVGVGVAVPGARAANKPLCLASFDAGLPDGVVWKHAAVTANDVITVALQNVTGADIHVGAIATRVVALQFA